MVFFVIYHRESLTNNLHMYNQMDRLDLTWKIWIK